MTQNPFYPQPDLPAISLRPWEAAQALGVSLSTLERYTRSGELRAAKIGRCTVYPVDVLKAWLASRMEGGSHATH
jgi:excisionase family DNA binding protein